MMVYDPTEAPRDVVAGGLLNKKSFSIRGAVGKLDGR